MGRTVKLLAIPPILAILLLPAGWWFQRCLIYFPSPDAPAAALPAGGEAVAFPTEDGLRLNGWFLPVRGGPARATVIVFNGNAGSRADRAPLATALAAEGLSVLLFDYRGFGGNPGAPSEPGLAADARAARAYLLSRGDVDSRRIVYYGESLGTAVAVALAAAQPPAALILRSPFTALADVGRRQYPFLPVDLLLQERYPAIEQIGRVSAPLLVIAGASDGLVPPEMSRRLFDAALGPKSYLLVPSADHADPRLETGPESLNAVRALLTTAGLNRRSGP